MKSSTRKVLGKADAKLVRKTEADALRSLDEDALIELHKRVRRARNKYSKLYRRRAGAQVGKDRSRSAASKAHRRTSAKAEVFEDALARVSRRLAKVAHARADQLREERLGAARAVRRAHGGPTASGGKGKAKASGGGRAERRRAKTKRRTPSRKRTAASSRAATRRHEARRASR